MVCSRKGCARSTLAGLAAALVAITLPAIGNADEWLDRASVTELMRRNDGNFGNCMIRLNKTPSETSCGVTRWVSLDCEGNYVSKADANAMFDMATASKLLGRQVWIYVTDTNTQETDGYCRALDMRIVD